MNLKKRNVVLAVACLCLLGIVGYAQATDIVGDVTVTERELLLYDLTIPATVNPTETVQMSWTISYVGGVCSLPDGLDYFYTRIYHESIDPLLDAFGPLFQSICFKRDGGWQFENPEGWTVATDPILGADVSFLDTQESYTFSVDTTFDSVALSGTWYLDIWVRLWSDATEGDMIHYTTPFQMNQYASLEIDVPSFSWGDVQFGSVNIPIVSPVTGFLTMNIVVNNRYGLQVMGTDPTSVEEYTFPVSNIKVSTMNDPLTAQPLTTLLTDLIGVNFDSESVSIQIYIWISVPQDQFLSTYLTTLSFVLAP